MFSFKKKISLLIFSALMAEAFPCPAAPGMGDKETLLTGQKMVEEGLISPHPLSPD